MKTDYIDWAKKQLTALNLTITSDFQVIRDMPWSKVYCFNTAIGKIYLKWMSPAFSNEAVLLHFLNNKGFSSIPHVLASNPALQCFLMEDRGVVLRDILKKQYDISLAARAVIASADLQIASIPYIAELVQLGVDDWRLTHLPGIYQRFMQQEALLEGDGLLLSEVKTLEGLQEPFQALCEKLASFSIPETLEQGDFHDNNILILEDEITLNDFGDASIAHPFFSLASYLDSASRHHALNEKDKKTLEEAYLLKWRSFAEEESLWEAYQLAKVLHLFVFTLSFSRMTTCAGIELFPQYKGYMANALSAFANKVKSFL